MRPPICDKTAPPHLENPGSATVDVMLCETERPRLLSGLLLSHPVKIHNHQLEEWTHARYCSVFHSRVFPLLLKKPIKIRKTVTPLHTVLIKSDQPCAIDVIMILITVFLMFVPWEGQSVRKDARKLGVELTSLSSFSLCCVSALVLWNFRV